MSGPDDELQKYFDQLSAKAKKQMRAAIRKQADRVSDAIRSAAAIGDTGNLAKSVRVEDGSHDLELVVAAGGDLTTKTIREGSGLPYDYALAVEFGTSKMEPNPFFFSTWRVMKDDVQAELEKAAAEILK